jgi:cell division protein FtsB
VWGFVRQSWLAVVLFAVAGALLASAAWSERGLGRVWQLQAELEEAQDRNFRLLQQVSTLRRELARTDDARIEHLARRYLGMVRPGEVLYRVPPSTDGAAEAAALTDGIEDDAALDDEPKVAPADDAAN